MEEVPGNTAPRLGPIETENAAGRVTGNIETQGGTGLSVTYSNLNLLARDLESHGFIVSPCHRDAVLPGIPI